MAEHNEIAQLGHPILRGKAESVTDIKSTEIQSIIEKMMRCVEQAGGVGIAAPQMYINQRIFIMCSKPNVRYPDAPLMQPKAIINPEILSTGSKKLTDWEGCLSVPAIRGLVPRFETIHVKYWDANAQQHEEELTGFLARIFQHELDHLDGLTFIDRMNSRQDLISETEWRRQFLTSN